ncbi:MAG: UDP-2,3-diacylglucosamine diphosphatase LpxI [Planctomycetia bacterium]|nr:UDP-2,3-diacylglucosamine diphosphatase LpxI [Planctomycetia bacterium]
MRKICLVAGWGRYPVYVAQALTKQGYEVHCFGVVNHAFAAELRAVCRAYYPVGMCRPGKIVRYMRRHGITDFITLGKYYKWKLFQNFGLIYNFPDLLTLRMFAGHFLTRKQDCKDDSLMTTLEKMFARFGLRLGCPTDFVPELLAGEGVLTKATPSESDWETIRYGQSVARELGRFDVGQSVVLAQGTVVALEALEGTDACIERAGKLCTAGNLILVKMAKPNQDMRFDVPTIGMTTLEHFAQVGGRVIAVEAERTILVDQPEMIAFANQRRIAIVVIK